MRQTGDGLQEFDKKRADNIKVSNFLNLNISVDRHH